MSGEAFSESAPKGGGFTERMLAAVERAGNKVPSPAILFLALILSVVVLSQVLDWANVSVTSEVAAPTSAEVQGASTGQSGVGTAEDGSYEVKTEEIAVKGLLTGDGVRFMATSVVSNFLGFAAVGVILVAMIGVGIAEYSGLIGALIRKLVASAPPALLLLPWRGRCSSSPGTRWGFRLGRAGRFSGLLNDETPADAGVSYGASRARTGDLLHAMQ